MGTFDETSEYLERLTRMALIIYQEFDFLICIEQ